MSRTILSRWLAYRRAKRAVLDNNKDLWSAIRIIREAVETLGPVGAVEAEEGVLRRAGPEPHHEAEAIIKGIMAMAQQHTDDLRAVLVIATDRNHP